jgi:hypothetical protein
MWSLVLVVTVAEALWTPFWKAQVVKRIVILVSIRVQVLLSGVKVWSQGRFLRRSGKPWRNGETAFNIEIVQVV